MDLRSKWSIFIFIDRVALAKQADNALGVRRSICLWVCLFASCCSFTVYDVSVPDSWSSVPYTIGLWRKFLCDVIKMAAWCIIFCPHLANNCTDPSSTVPYSLIMWLLFPYISYCVRDRDIVDGVFAESADGEMDGRTLHSCFAKLCGR